MREGQKPVTVWLPDTLYEWFKSHCKERHIKMSDILRSTVVTLKDIEDANRTTQF